MDQLFTVEKLEKYIELQKKNGADPSMLAKKLNSVLHFFEYLVKHAKISPTIYEVLHARVNRELNGIYIVTNNSLDSDKSGTLTKISILFRRLLSSRLLNRSKQAKTTDEDKLNLPQIYVGSLIVLVFMAILGAGIYSRFFSKVPTPFAYPVSPVTGSRILSYQGRLTDSLGNPITTATNMVFKLYDNSSGGTQLYTSGTCSITPDTDGIFNTLIGSSCGSAIASSVFSENANVWLGTTVGSDSEMTPRQQIANVGYAMNAETLQGLPPGTSTANIPFISQTGDMLIGVAAPGIRSTFASTNFTVSSNQTMTLQASNTGDVVLQATGSGTVRIRTGGSTDAFTRVYVDNNGNVGIGTTATSTYNLTVNGSISGTTLYQGGTAINNSFVQLQGSSPGTQQLGNLNISGNGLFSGNVGIGTTTVGASLEVANSITGTSAATLYATKIDPTLTGTMSTSTPISNFYSIYNAPNINVGGTTPNLSRLFLDYKTANIGTGVTTSISNLFSDYIAAVTVNAGSTVSNKYALVTEAGAGNVGIGYTAPGTKLTVSGGLAVGTSSSSSSYLSKLAPDGGAIFEGNVGIGTTNPSLATLQVEGTIRVGSTATATSTNLCLGANNVIAGCTSGGGTVSGTGAAGQATFWTGASTLSGSNNFWWDNTNGRLGLGISAPSEALDIGGTAANLTFSSGTGSHQIKTGGTTDLALSPGGNVGIGVTSPKGKLQVNGGLSVGYGEGTTAPPSTGAIIAGNVGIGTSAPGAYALNVNGQTNINGGLTLPNSNIIAGNSGNIGISGGIGFGTTAAPTYYITSSGNAVLNVVGAANGTAAAPTLTFSGDTNTGLFLAGTDALGIASSGLERIRVAGNGNIGIGITSPNTKLSINGNAIIGYGEGVGYTAPSNGLFVNGNVGIGSTANTLANLDVNGTIRVASTGAAASTNLCLGTNNIISGCSASSNLSGSGAAGQATFWTGVNTLAGNNNFWWDSTNSRLGIGTSGPVNPLSVTGNANITGNLGVGVTSPTTKLHVNGGLTVGYGEGTTTPPANGAIINGNVGIGTSAPGAYTLNINGQTNINGGLTLPNSNIIAGNSGNIGISGGIGFGTTAAPTYYITSSGNAVLNVVGAANGTAAAPTHSFSGDTNTGLFLAGTDALGIASSGLERIRVAGNGNIGIGITSPNTKLSINGNAIIGYGEGVGFTAPSNGLFVSGNVGIGSTANTLANLDVNGTIRIASTAAATGTGLCLGTNNIIGGCNGLPTSAGTGAAGQVTYWNGANSITGTNNFWWDNSNTRLGIGTSAPTTSIDVTTSNNPYLNLTSTGSGNEVHIQMQNTGNTTAAIIGLVNTAGQIVGGSKISDLVFRTNVGSNMDFTLDQGNTIHAQISGNGNLGIGVTSAGSKLQINGGAVIGFGTSAIGAPSNGLFVSGNVGIGSTANTLANLDVSGTIRVGSTATGTTTNLCLGANNVIAGCSSNFISGSGVAGQATFWTGASTVAGSNNFWWDNTNGRLGLGISAPAEALDIGGTAANLTFSSGTGPHQIKTGGTTDLALVPGGNVGIGVTSPKGKLQINGGLSVGYGEGTTTPPANGAIISGFVGIGTSAPATKLTISGGLSVGSSSATSTYLSKLAPDGGAIFEGNIGIGFTTPSYKLDVNGTIRGDEFLDTSGVGKYGIDPAGSDANFGVAGGTLLSLATAQGASFGGNVGIGTTNPGGQLELAGSITGTSAATLYGIKLNPTLTGTMSTSTPITAYYNFYNNPNINVGGTTPNISKLYLDFNGANIGTGTSTSISNLYSNYISAPTVNAGSTVTNKYALVSEVNAGNIGFGVTSPSAKLQVNGGLSVGYGEGTTSPPSTGAIINGNVGIGTSSPVAPLHVNGTTAIFGVGEGGTPTATTIRGAAASGTDIAGATMTFDASNGTGTGGSGQFSFRTATNGQSLPIIDSTSSAGNSAATSVAWNHTVGSLGQSGKSVLIVGVSIRNASSQTVSTITFGAQSLSNLSSINIGTSARTELWYLKNPTAGTSTITVTLSGSSTDLAAGAASYYNVDQTNTFNTPATNTGTGTTASVTITSSNSTDLLVGAFTKVNSTEAPSVQDRSNWSTPSINATASNNVYSSGNYATGGVSNTPLSVTWTTTSRAWAAIAVAIKAVSTSGSSLDTLAEMLNIGQQAVTVKGLFNIGPSFRFSRTTVAYNASTFSKDSTCSTDFGANYQAAMTRDIAMYFSNGVSNSVNARNFNSLDASTISLQGNDSQISNIAGGTYPIGCIRKDSPIRFTRSSNTVVNNDATKDNQCTREFGANYQAASLPDVGIYSQYGINTGTPHFPFNVQGDTTKSYNNNTGGAVFTGSLYTLTGGVYPTACIRTGTQTGADYAELIPTMDTPTAGDILSADEVHEVMAKREDKEYSNKIIGIVATEPGFVLGSSKEGVDDTVLALSGRVPVKVMTESPESLLIGDYITSSDLAGIGQKLTRVGPTVGKLLQSSNTWNEALCPSINYEVGLQWPVSDGQNSNKPCFRIARSSLPSALQTRFKSEYIYVGKLMVQVGLSWADPAIYMTQSGEVVLSNNTAAITDVYHGNLATTQDTLRDLQYTLTNKLNSVITTTSSFSDIISAKINAGYIETQNAVVSGVLAVNQTITNTLQATKITTTNLATTTFTALNGSIQNLTASQITTTDKIVSPVVETEQLNANKVAAKNINSDTINTNEIKPANNDVVINLNTPVSPTPSTTAPQSQTTGPLAKLLLKGKDGNIVSSFDAEGNATFSGTIASTRISTDHVDSQRISTDTLSGNEVSIAGTLAARQIKADNIDQLASQVNGVQKLLADLQNQPLSNPQYYQSVPSTGSLIQCSAGQQCNNETMQQFNNLTVTGSSNLYNATVANSFVAGNVQIQDNAITSLSWDLKLSALASINMFDGAVVIAKDGTITTQGTVIAKGGVKTNTIEAINKADDVNIKLATNVGNGLKPFPTNSQLNIQNDLGTTVASIDASGSAKFKDIALEKYTSATSSGAVIAAMDNFQKNGLFSAAIETQKQSAGNGVLPQNEQDIVIYNGSVKSDSMIYLTPTSTTEGTQLSVTQKVGCSATDLQCRPYFKVHAENLLHPEILFDWLIIN